MIATRDQVRQDLRVWMARTGWSLQEIAEGSGYARQTLAQFVSGARFGDASDQGETAQKLAGFLAANPAPLPEFPPGKFYETESTRAMRGLVADAREGVWGTCYGPAGAQKSFLFETVYAESVREENPWCALVTVPDMGMTPRGLLAEIARAMGAPYAWQTSSLRRAILYELRRRQVSLAVVIDEAQRLYPMLDTLECLRGLGDLAHGRLGILVVGNEDVLNLFEPRRRSSMEQWRSRIEQRRMRVLGPTEREARQIATSELGAMSEKQLEFLMEKSSVTDPLSPKRRYVNMRRLFNAMRDYRRERAKQKVQ